ncbi:endonuclease/exonuclease/phosphatase family metal-dependent hydrolase [Streptomyces aurantiacus]|uniref:endonuclease/exonuclease/phosphatase family protein n=1 Tax=Streptomyces aurantiacus TaxID=47760 RepID=UPI00278CA8F8|nr:endonuclease/exonuclease/phosphatase family protein [Streptomyces aurantiacus]MDQ0779485.1 endonuclease/exonuclease/phosphatase family metal-dependent hydrolase [Streptomyces aurantiacus]
MTTRRTGLKRRRGAVRALVTALLCVLVALPARSGAASRAAVVPDISRGHYVGVLGYVGTFNIYGNIGHRGDAGDWIRDEADAISELTLGDMDRWLFIGLQEVCQAQGERFARELGMRSAFVDTGTDCADGQPYGNALLFHEAVRILPPALLPNTDGRGGERGIICAVVRAPESPDGAYRSDGSGRLGPPVTACSTHLSVGRTRDRERQEQTEFIHDDWKPDGTHPLGADGPVVLAGDLNAPPDARELDVMYGGDGSEASGPPESGPPYTRPTYDDGRKIDYLFTWGERGAGRWHRTGAHRTVNSDHSFYYSELSTGTG